MKGWLDKYGKELNANEGYSSAPDNWVGEGYSTQGRNYSPAWGGQFKDGGKKGPGDDIDKKEKAKKIVEIARRRIANNDYVEVPEDIKNASYAEGKNPYGCIGGVCTVAKEAGALPRVYWSNTGFAKDAPNLGFPNNGYGLKGIQNLEPGDFIQYLTEPEGKDEEGNVKYVPRHAQIFLGVNPDTKQYEFFDNQNKAMMSYPESMIKDKLKNTKHPYDYGAVIYKNNPFHPTANSFTDETLQDATNRVDSTKREKETPTKYKYSIRSDAKDYNNDTKDIMNTFVNYANDNNKLNNLVSKLGIDKEEIHDSLLNVFGELGQENNWTNTGKGVKSKLENIAEKTMAFFGGGKNYSIGPGQNKFSSIPKDLRDKFGIKSTKDLYNLEKVIPLMVGQDILNKKTLRNWGEKNLLSDKLIGHTDNVTPLIADDLKGGVGRWSPYLRNEYGLISNNKRLINNNDLIPFNTDVVPNYDPTIGFFMNPHKLDEGSYPDKVFHKTDDNLQRELITPSSEKFPDELSPFTVISKKRDGGYMSKEVQFAMGGSMPGSVGFTYARTNNPAPSNGPYAKKTKASAQDGKNLHPIDLHLPIYEKPKPSLNPYAFYVHPQQDVHVAGIGAHAQGNINDRLNLSGGLHSTSVSYPGGKKMFMKPEYHVGMKYRFDNGGSMSYYQHGLDWKPKSISKNGSDVPKNQNAKYTLPRFDMPRAASESTSAGISKKDVELLDELAKRKQFEKYVTNQPQFKQGKKSTPESEARRKMLNQQYVNTHPYAKLNSEGDLERTNWDRNMQGVADAYTPAAKLDRGMTTLANGLEAAGYVTGAGELAGAGYNAAKEVLAKNVINPLIESSSKNVLSKTLNSFSEKHIADFNKYLTENNLMARQVFGEPAYNSFLQRGPSILETPQSEQLLQYVNAPKTSLINGAGENFETISSMVPKGEFHKQFGYPYFSNKSLWYNDPKSLTSLSRTGESAERVFVADPKNFPEGMFAPAGESSIITSSNPSEQLVSDYAGSRRAMLPYKEGFDASKFNVFEKHPIQGYVPENFKPWEISKYVEGGVIKDDMGYWNPDNHGKIVEISSSDITMEGVDQPLLGISDTGDTKLMQPGNNYKFKGKKVTEYPMAQKGINKPIYTEDPRKVQAYNDSLNLYNQYKTLGIASERNQYNKTPDRIIPYKNLPSILPFNSFDDRDINIKSGSFNQTNRDSFFADTKIKPVAFEQYSSLPNVGHSREKKVFNAVYKKPVQPYILQKEHKLNPRVLDIQPIDVQHDINVPGITTLQHPPTSSHPIPEGNYMLGYHDENNQGVDRGFITPEQRTDFIKDLQSRNLSGVQPYMGNITEYYKTPSKKKNGGWLDKYK